MVSVASMVGVLLMLVFYTSFSAAAELVESKKCSISDIVITQGPGTPLPNGIPTYTVAIMNACATGCDISGIHLSCGWFSSARLVDPSLFRRLRFNDCLVHDGKTLKNGESVSFAYANEFPYRLAVSSLIC